MNEKAEAGGAGERPPVAAIGEVLAYTVRETSHGVYECQLCDADVSQQPFAHEESCEGEVVRRWLDSQGSGGAVGEREEPLDVERLARALIDSGLIARYSDYALRAHPTSMTLEDPLDIARGWAADIAARLSVNEGGPVEPQEPR